MATGLNLKLLFCQLLEMTLSILQGLLQEYVRSLFDEGILNDQFNHIYTLKKTEKPDSVVNLIENYFADVDVIISKLSNHVNKSNVDFCKLADLAREIEEKSTRTWLQIALHRQSQCHTWNCLNPLLQDNVRDDPPPLLSVFCTRAGMHLWQHATQG